MQISGRYLTLYPCFFLIAAISLSSCAMPDGPVQPRDDVPEAEGWQAEQILSGLEHPWSVIWTAEDTMLISERPGRLRIVSGGTLEPEPLAGLPEIYNDGQAGLMDLSLHPDFEENRLLYFTFAQGDENQNSTAVGRAVFSENALHETEIIFRAEPLKSDDQHFGGRMAWLTDGTFLVTIGDGGNRPQSIDGVLSREYAQKPDSHLGKVIRLHDDGSVPEDNPFLNEPGIKPEIWTLGHRNIQGVAADPETGHVWASEHGSRGGDELNLLEAGKNYGWPVVTYSREYYGPRISDKTAKPGMEDPKAVWTPAQAPSGLAVYTGDVFPEWKGSLFSGGLQGEQVRRIVLDGDTVVREESLTIGRRVRDVRQGPDGHLYILTDHANGELIRVINTE
jgi:aldose sugar dehydrogenase